MLEETKKYYKPKMQPPAGSITVKALSTKLGFGRSIIPNIINYLKIEPVYIYISGKVTKTYYSDSLEQTVLDFIKEHPDTKSFFITLANANRTVKAKQQAVEKARRTTIERYGVDNISKLPEVCESKLKRFEERNGISMSEYMSSVTKANREQRVETIIQRYGEDWSKQFSEKAVSKRDYAAIFAKGKAKILDTYGVDNFGKSPGAKAKAKNTRNNKYEEQLRYLRNNNAISICEIMNIYSTYSFAIYRACIKFNIEIKHLEYKQLAYITLDELQVILPEIARIRDTGTQRSAKEQEVLEFIKTNYDGVIETNTRKVIAPKELDIYLPELSLVIEFNGLFYHCTAADKALTPKSAQYHINKSNACAEQGIRLIHIYEHEWDNLVQREKVKSILLSALQKNTDRIYARKCAVKEVSNSKVKDFNDMYHLKGHRNAQRTFGLFYNNELVQLMSFSSTRYNKNLKADTCWELIRSTSKANTSVIGGASKLLKYFIQKLSPTEIFTYCDFNKFDGHGYEKLGFKCIGQTRPDMSWVFKTNDPYGINYFKVESRNPNKHKEQKETAFGQLYGAGSKKYLYSVEVKVNENSTN